MNVGLKGWKRDFMLGQPQQELDSRIETNKLGTLVEEGAPGLVAPTIHSGGSRDPER